MSRNLRIALTKGRLLERSVELFEGHWDWTVRPSGIRGGGWSTQCPIIRWRRYLPKRRTSSPMWSTACATWASWGKTPFWNRAKSFYEVLNLGFGRCRFALAVKEGSDFYGTYRTRRVASKYPNVTRAFFARKGMDVEIIKIEGSVELAPILDLADGIVDIVETGATLRENGLTPIEDVAQVSARLIVNTASMKLHKAQIEDLIGRCEAELEKRRGEA